MSNKKDDQQKQRNQYMRRRMVKDAETGEVIAQDHPGYNVPMIRDFLEHLLLELRVQHWELSYALKKLQSEGKAEQPPPAPALIEQLQVFTQKHMSALICATAFDTRNATKEEIAVVQEAALRVKIEARDEQIGHMESLQELFEEALTCAKFPFGPMKGGGNTQPHSVVNVREWVDRIEGGKE